MAKGWKKQGKKGVKEFWNSSKRGSSSVKKFWEPPGKGGGYSKELEVACMAIGLVLALLGIDFPKR